MPIGPRKAANNQYSRAADEELEKNPPKLVWEHIRGGIWVVRKYEDSHRRGNRPPCKCNLYGSPKRRWGDHHDEDCERRNPW